MNQSEIIAAIKELNIVELNDLVKAIEEEFGVSAVASVAVAAGPAAAEKTDFSVKLVSAGAKKIGVIKVVREVTGLGLKEAKALVDAAPDALVKENIPQDAADELKAKLEEAGAEVELV